MFTHENMYIIIIIQLELEYQYRINDQSAFILVNVQWREARGGSTLRYSLYYEYMYTDIHDILVFHLVLPPPRLSYLGSTNPSLASLLTVWHRAPGQGSGPKSSTA